MVEYSSVKLVRAQVIASEMYMQKRLGLCFIRDMLLLYRHKWSGILPFCSANAVEVSSANAPPFPWVGVCVEVHKSFILKLKIFSLELLMIVKKNLNRNPLRK